MSMAVFSVRGNFRGSVGGYVRGNARGNVRGNIRGCVHGNVHSYVRDFARGNVHGYAGAYCTLGLAARVQDDYVAASFALDVRADQGAWPRGNDHVLS